MHSFMELAAGNRFSIDLQIANPNPCDIGFAAFWEQALKNGLLRLGGLISAGRGRLNISQGGTEIRLFARSCEGFPGFEKQEQNASDDILAGLFHEYIMTDWTNRKNEYLGLLKSEYEKLGN